MIGSCRVTCTVATKKLLWAKFQVPDKPVAEVVSQCHNQAV